MRAFHNEGWEFYVKCSSIMYSSAACGSHVFRPTTATVPVFNEAEDNDSNTTVNPLAMVDPSATTVTITTGMDTTSKSSLPTVDHLLSTAATAMDPSSLSIVDHFLLSSVVAATQMPVDTTSESSLPTADRFLLSMAV